MSGYRDFLLFWVKFGIVYVFETRADCFARLQKKKDRNIKQVTDNMGQMYTKLSLKVKVFRR